jgi:hypothetical protein
MPHELKGMQALPHEFFTYILTAGGFFGLLLVGVVGYLRWKHRDRVKRLRDPARVDRSRRKRKRQ